MRVICAWCGGVKQAEDGAGGPDSHGICAACAAEHYGMGTILETSLRLAAPELRPHQVKELVRRERAEAELRELAAPENDAGRGR